MKNNENHTLETESRMASMELEEIHENNEKHTLEIENRMASMELEEIHEITNAARAVTSNYNAQFLEAPELMSRLTKDYRRANIEVVRNYVEWKEAADYRDDLIYRFVELRKALQAIGELSRREDNPLLNGIQAVAREALRLDDGQEKYMQSEFGYGVDDVLHHATEAARAGNIHCECARCRMGGTTTN